MIISPKILITILLIIMVIWALNDKYNLAEKISDSNDYKKDKGHKERHYLRSILIAGLVMAFTFEDTPEKNAWDNLVSNLYWTLPVSILVFMYLKKPEQKQKK